MLEKLYREYLTEPSNLSLLHQVIATAHRAGQDLPENYDQVKSFVQDDPEAFVEACFILTKLDFKKLNDPSYAAYGRVYHRQSPAEWAMRVIENDKIGDPAWAAYQMAKRGHASEEWADRVAPEWRKYL